MGPSKGKPQLPGIVRSGRVVGGGDTGGGEDRGDCDDGTPGDMLILMDMVDASSSSVFFVSVFCQE